MSDVGFTKGPWEAQITSKYASIFGDINTDYDGDNPFVCQVKYDNIAANAHLISASPTMFHYIKKCADNGCDEAAAICKKATNASS